MIVSLRLRLIIDALVLLTWGAVSGCSMRSVGVSPAVSGPQHRDSPDPPPIDCRDWAVWSANERACRRLGWNRVEGWLTPDDFQAHGNKKVGIQAMATVGEVLVVLLSERAGGGMVVLQSQGHEGLQFLSAELIIHTDDPDPSSITTVAEHVYVGLSDVDMDGIAVIDLDETGQLHQVDSWISDDGELFSISELFAVGEWVYALSSGRQVLLSLHDDPDQGLRLVSESALAEPATCLVGQIDRLYLCLGEAGLALYDTTDPQQPTMRLHHRAPITPTVDYEIRDLVRSGDVLFAATGNSEADLLVLALDSATSQVTEVHGFASNAVSNCTHIVAAGSRLLLTCGDDVAIIDTRRPWTPRLSGVVPVRSPRGVTPVPGRPGRVAIATADDGILVVKTHGRDGGRAADLEILQPPAAPIR